MLFSEIRGKPLSDLKTMGHAFRQRFAACSGTSVGQAFPLIFGVDVKQKGLGRITAGVLTLAIMFLTACSAPQAKDFKGSWHAVNRYRSSPTEIPLHRRYTFFAAPIDETLKSMLTRWSVDTNRTLRYELNYDVTLYKPVATIRTTDLEAAASTLNSIYAAQGVHIVSRPGEILVQSTNHLSPPSRTPSRGSTKSEAASP